MSPLILDMVHHNPGGTRYQSKFEEPEVVRDCGYNGKVYFLFDSPTLAVNWESVAPDILPAGSPDREWVDAKAAQIDKNIARAKAAGLRVYAMSDLILFPKRLVEKYHLQETMGDPANPQTEKFLRALVSQVFARFPDMDGLVVRIGETYLQDAPYHAGDIHDSYNAQKTIIPLVRLLREELCVKRHKQLLFRTWNSFDTDLSTYLQVSDAIEPDPYLFFSIKQCEGDFQRGNPFSKVIGAGRHKQIIEVQCAREYEGKGAYPNYIAHGVIEGFEEHQLNPSKGRFNSVGAFARESPLYAGIWTWSRGGGWDGPYIKDELWCELNAWVMSKWARDPKQSEESIFNQFVSQKLGLRGDDLKKFRKLCLLSEQAVVRGKTGTRREFSPWWSRDDALNEPQLPGDPKVRQRISDQQEEAVKLWREIVQLADEIKFPASATAEHVRVSSRYGLHLYRIYQAFIGMNLVGKSGVPEKLRQLLADYDSAWADFRRLDQEHPCCATLYKQEGARYGFGVGQDKVVKEFRQKVATASSHLGPEGKE